MDKALEELVKVFKHTFKLNKKEEARIKKQVSYLEYGFHDLLVSYDDGKIGLDSLIIFFGYFFGIVIEDEVDLETFISLIEASYLASKSFKEKS